MQIACQTYWIGGGLVGVAIGAALPAPIKGLEFALCALFTVLTLDAFRSRREIPSALLAAASVTVALVVTPRSPCSPHCCCSSPCCWPAMRSAPADPPGRPAMPDAWYIVAVLAIVFTITLALRAVPFAPLRTLRGSAVVPQLSVSMPVGILVILALTALHGTISAEPQATLDALLAVAVTAGIHLACGRRTILERRARHRRLRRRSGERVLAVSATRRAP